MSKELRKDYLSVFWRLDKGRTYKEFEKRHAAKMRALPKGTKVYPTDFYYEVFRGDNGWKKFATLDVATIAGLPVDETQIKVRVKGYKTLHNMWVGFYDTETLESKL